MADSSSKPPRDEARVGASATKLTDDEPVTKTCTVDGCSRPYKARGYCRMHHLRWWRRGDPGAETSEDGKRRIYFTRDYSLRERFLAKVGEATANGCWPWLGQKMKTGYGRFNLEPKRSTCAHRAALVILRGMTIPPAMTVDHLCRNRADA